MNERWRRLNANMRQYVPLRANMGQHCSLTAVQRKTACVEESWWPELNLFGSMPLCSFPWHTLLPRLMQNNCCTVYSLNLIREFTSLFRRSDFCRFAKESLPTEVGKGRHWTSVFFCGCTSRSQDSPKASPMAIFKWKNLIGQLNPLLEWMLNESWRRLNANTSQTQHVPLRANIASHQLCREKQPLWKSHDDLNLSCLDQCHGLRSLRTSTSQGWRKRIVIQSTV